MVLIPVFLLIAVGGTVAFASIEPNDETPQTYPRDHPRQKILDRNMCTKHADMCFSEVTTEERSQSLVFVWGPHPPPIRDKWKFSDFTAECGGIACGNASVDEEFNLADPVIQ